MSSFTAFKEHYGLSQCIKCGKDTTDVNHHLYCEKCWWINQLDKIAKSINAESFKVINGMVS